MNILHVYKDNYPPVKGGIEFHINTLANGLRARGIDVNVLVANTTATFQVVSDDGITIAKAPQWGRWYSAPITPFFFRYLNRFGKKVDIIHFHHPNPTAEFSYLFTHLHQKTVVTYHSDIIRQQKLEKLYAPFQSIFWQTVDRIILFVGRFRYYKGLHVLISAMKDIEASLLLIGTGPEEQRLRKMVEKIRLEHKIDFLGDLSDEMANGYYNACDIFVLPSHLRSEAFGIVLVEAMCCGKPSVSTELGTGTSFANMDHETGITVQPNDSKALSNVLTCAL